MSATPMTRGAVVAVVLGIVPAGLAAQGIASRVDAVQNGRVHLSFAARPGVCGNGRNINMSSGSGDWESDCEPGPVRVSLERAAGATIRIRTYVGGRWRPGVDSVTDLGTVPAAQAAHYLLDVARHGDGRPGSDAILGAALADSVTVGPDLLGIARSPGVPTATRKSAVFWLGQAAGEAAVQGLTGLATEGDQDEQVKESAIFALSQLHNGAGVEPLIKIARSSADPRLRKKAIFWLGQSDDPRALALFEELLTGKL
jgi:HEAT repeats